MVERFQRCGVGVIKLVAKYRHNLLKSNLSQEIKVEKISENIFLKIIITLIPVSISHTRYDLQVPGLLNEELRHDYPFRKDRYE